MKVYLYVTIKFLVIVFLLNRVSFFGFEPKSTGTVR